MKNSLTILGIWMLTLSACIFEMEPAPPFPDEAFVSPTATAYVSREDSPPEILSDCFLSFKVAAWHDLNGNGQWENSELPLEGVRFQLQGVYAEQWGPDPDEIQGQGWYSILIWSPGECKEREYIITAIAPHPYEPTTPSSIKFPLSPPYEAQFGFRSISK